MVSLAGPILTRSTSLLVLESEALFHKYGLSRGNRDRIGRERRAERERRRHLEIELHARHQAASAARQARREEGLLAQADRRKQVKLWDSPGGGGGGGFSGGGGGAGGPLLLLVSLLGAAAARRRGARAAV